MNSRLIFNTFSYFLSLFGLFWLCSGALPSYDDSYTLCEGPALIFLFLHDTLGVYTTIFFFFSSRTRKSASRRVTRIFHRRKPKRLQFFSIFSGGGENSKRQPFPTLGEQTSLDVKANR
jgi:hypothetical protein